jgi:hypothetical protein
MIKLVGDERPKKKLHTHAYAGKFEASRAIIRGCAREDSASAQVPYNRDVEGTVVTGLKHQAALVLIDIENSFIPRSVKVTLILNRPPHAAT